MVDAAPQLSPSNGTGTERPAGAAHRVADLLRSLTLDEKIQLLHQYQPGVERLGLDQFRTGSEGLHGVAWLGTATTFPQPVGLAATWDPAFLAEVGEVVSTEMRAKHATDPTVSLNIWAPVVNTLRHPLWGRTEEGFSEDPDLTAALATGYATGLRGCHAEIWKTVPTLKHFLAYGNETDRATTSSHLPPQALREYELPAFEAPIASGTIGAVMPGYNLINGRPNHVSGELLSELRARAPHSIAVVSDAQAPSNVVDGERYYPDHTASHAALVRAGIDSFTDNDSNAGLTVERVTAALEAGLLDEADIDLAVRRLLEMRSRTGELTGEDPFGIGENAIDTDGHRALAREAAARGVVVLANDGGALPLRPGRRIAVVGPFADHIVHDWYSGTPPYLSTLAGALAERYPEASVTVADGADRIALRSLTHDRVLGVTADGQALTASAVTADDASLLDVTDWGDGVLTIRSVQTGLLLTGASWIIAPTSDRVGGWVAQESFRAHRHDDGSVSYQHIGSGTWLRVQHGSMLLVAEGGFSTAERFSLQILRSGVEHVAETARGADVTIVAVGNDPHLLGRETEDRTSLELPTPFRELWLSALGSADEAILAIASSYPYALGAEAAGASAVIWSSHGGQEHGHGLVDVLSGDREPVGRLAQTWWDSTEAAGDLLEYDVVGASMTYRYSPERPQFALGHGLTYSRVVYEGIELSAGSADSPEPTLVHTPAREAAPGSAPQITAVVTVRNAGDREAHELVALYAEAPALAVPAPRIRLVAWTRVVLAPGESRVVSLPVPLGTLAVWDVGTEATETSDVTPGAFRVQPGTYRIASGSSAGDLSVGAHLVIRGEEPRPRPVALLQAHGFHASNRVVTSDRSRESGSSIEVLPTSASGWTRYDNLDLTGLRGILLDVSTRDLPAWGPSTVHLDVKQTADDRWVPLTSVLTIAPTDRYSWTWAGATLVDDPRLGELLATPIDLRVTLGGAARVAAIRMER
ncbi:glycoside hydrolase family 3 C-terminal domain-containing protein [Mycetocola sp. 2940]|uniref:glycoside hydrolase family 3 C-terminal domain-containing protein n=1 Tax=Mycetocola sp. 2940 TaxID=3156452 RepID=UPI0033948B62